MEDVKNSSEPPMAEWETAAEGGSEEHQRKLGLYYLKQYDLRTNVDSSAGLATKWLMQASRVGDSEATAALRRCLHQNIGITPENHASVQWCLTTPAWEKQVRVAAAAMFLTIKPSQTETLSREEYLQHLDNVATSPREKLLLEKAGKGLGEEPLTKEAFVEHIVQQVQGKGSTMFSTLMASDSQNQPKVPTKKSNSPMQSPLQMIDPYLEMVATHGVNFILKRIPTNQIQLLVNVTLYSALSIGILFHALPIITFYFSLTTMVLTTLQMSYNSLKSRDIHIHTRLLKKFDGRIDSDQVLTSFSWNSLTPNAVFFVALMVLLLSHAVANHAAVLSSLLFVVAMFASCASLFLLSHGYHNLLLLSVICNLGASLPLLLPEPPNIVLLGSLLRFVCHPWLSFEFGKELQFHVGLPSLLFLAIPCVLVGLAMQHSWRGTQLYLVPHLICLCWWHVALLFFQQSSVWVVAQLCVGWALLTVGLPILTVGAIAGVAMLMYWIIKIATVLQIAIALIVVVIGIGLAVWVLKLVQLGKFSMAEMATKRTGYVMIITLVAIFLLVNITNPEKEEETKYVTWDDYRRLCSAPQWENTNMAHVQTKCVHFKQMQVSWSGKVKDVEAISISNHVEDFVSQLPDSVANWLRCMFGERCSSSDEPSRDKLDQCYTCNIHGPDYCHFHNFDHYDFEVYVTMQINDQETQELRLRAGHQFRARLMSLRAEQVITFNATLHDNLGWLRPELVLHHVRQEGVSDTTVPASDIQPPVDSHKVATQRAKQVVHQLLNFFLAPVLHFGSPLTTKHTP